MERERKFLLDSLPSDLHKHPHELIEQGYLAVEKGPHPVQVRLRKHGRQWVLTVKVGSGEIREEKELAISASHARSIWPLTRGRRVKKTRYKILYRDWSIEVDIYHGKAKGLRVAEVEFSSKSDARRFEAPPWFGREVTGAKQYSNVEIAQRGRKRGK